MLITIISWLYIYVVCLLAGLGFRKLLSRFLPLGKVTSTRLVITGITALTVYTEFFSIFYKIGWVCHVLMLLIILLGAFLCRKDLMKLLAAHKKDLFSWNILLYIGLILLFAFFTSRGAFHTDTNIYHAQNIRIYEEYGLIRGMGNLQQHYAYNSAYLAFASLFSMSFLLPFSLHTTTGFLALIIGAYACKGLRRFWTHEKHLGDFARISILIYILVNITGCISPASDYGAMYFVLFLITEWLNVMEHPRKNRETALGDYALLSVLGLFTATLKLSAALLVLLAVYPGICFIKKKNWKKIAVSLLLGVLVFLPFLIRNYLISGWLFYPFAGIDLFQVDWKVPVSALIHDSDQIKVWGRCLYDVAKTDLPVSQWLPVWWNAKERYEQMLIYANILGFILVIINHFKIAFRRKKVRLDCLTLYGVIFLNIIFWFLEAPFIRYGLAFLILLPLLDIGGWMELHKGGIYSMVSGVLVILICLCFCPYIDHYVTDDGVFIKQNLTESYYLLQKNYDTAETLSKTINGNTIYYSPQGIINSYYYCPCTCYEEMLDASTLRGDSIQDGFRAK